MNKMELIIYRNRIWITLIISLFLITGVISCDNELITETSGILPDEGGMEKITGILRSSQSFTNKVAINFTEDEETATDLIYFQLSKPLASSITIDVTIDEALVEQYNEVNKTKLKPFPSQNLQIENSLKIKEGKLQSEKTKLIISTKGLEVDSIYLLALSTIQPPPKSIDTYTMEQTLYYGIKIQKKDVSNMPLDENFITVFYVNTEEYNPLLADIFALQKQNTNTFENVWEHTIGNIINLKPATVGYDAATKRALFTLSSDLRYILENANKYIRPMQDKGRKICICIQGSGKGIGFCNMNDDQIADFTAQIKNVVDQYQLDGINLWDEKSGYGKAGMPAINTSSYPKLIKALREAMPDKLLTLVDKDEPTEYFYDVQQCGGIEVGKYIDYAWSGYNSENEKLQLLDPWNLMNSYSIYQRKPIAGLLKEKYGQINMPFYPVNSSVDPDWAMRILEWRFGGNKHNNILIFADLITLLQGSYEGSISNTFSAYELFSDDAIDENFNFLFSYKSIERYRGALAEFPDGSTGYGKWKKDW